MDIKVIDYHSPQASSAFAASLRETGFAVLENHPVGFETVERLWSEWLAFFKSERKWEFVYGEGEQAGYRPLSGSETAVGATVKDIKEYFHLYPWGRNPSPEDEVALELFHTGSALAATLLGWVERETPVEVRSTFATPLPKMLENSERTLLRILHYPPLDGSEPEGALRAAAHEDINLLTVLPSANEPGLQVLDRTGRWHDVPCDPGTIVVNCGDMLELVSGGYYPSTTHRVLNPTGEAAKRSRVSTPLFLHPQDDVELRPGFTALDFLDERVKQTTGQGLQRKNPAA
ncbi:MAG: 2OG-Fe(II) oxygenase family protein [Nitrospiraceae bacterium]